MDLFKNFFKHLYHMGVARAVFCPGARNSHLLHFIENHGGFHTFFHSEERSASFFSLGQNQAEQKLVSFVVVTSGTAVSECFSAVIEACYQKIPFLVISADRPKSWGRTGAPQTILQQKIFGNYALYTELDFENPPSCMELAGWIEQIFHPDHLLKPIPIHINCYLPDPRNRRTQFNWGKKDDRDGLPRKPLVVVGPLVRANEVSDVTRWLRQNDLLTNYPILAEASSNVFQYRQSSFHHCWIKHWVEACSPDGIIKIGGTPVFDFWRDIEHETVPVWNFSSTGYPGIARSCHFVGKIEDLFSFPWSFEQNVDANIIWRSWEKKALQNFECLMMEYPLAEWSWMRRIVRDLNGSFVYLGNSMPVREFELTSYGVIPEGVWSYRGVNGIDGQLSGFLGWVIGLPRGARAVALVGDLTAFYDLQSLWIYHRYPEAFVDKCVVIIVLNNKGGQIFRSYFQHGGLVNEHHLTFQAWAQMFHIDYYKVSMPYQYVLPDRGFSVIEILPDVLQQQAMELAWQSLFGS